MGSSKFNTVLSTKHYRLQYFPVLFYICAIQTLFMVCLDKLRYVMASTTNASAAQLPQTKDAFRQHVPRSMYQTAVWNHSRVPKALLRNYIGKGWTVREDIKAALYQKPAAPQELRNITHPYCSDGTCSDCRECQCPHI